jgi:NADH-quinone oxidoreductase subunit J
LSLFSFAMLMLVTADSLVQMFFGWEGVGLASYLLIGFWYHKPSANAAGLMLLVGAEFIAMLVVIVYVGAVAVLFLFVVMMLDVDFATLRSGFTRNLPFGIIIALVLLAEIVIALFAHQAGPAFANGAIATAAQPNIVALGQLLYSRYLFAFEIAGLILLVAMIGAIVLTHRRRGDLRTPKVWKQNRRRPQDSIELIDPKVGEGMKL